MNSDIQRQKIRVRNLANHSCRHLVPHHYRILQPLVRLFVILDGRVTPRGIVMAREGAHGLVHLPGADHLQPCRQIKPLHRNAGRSDLYCAFNRLKAMPRPTGNKPRTRIGGRTV